MKYKNLVLNCGLFKKVKKILEERKQMLFRDVFTRNLV